MSQGPIQYGPNGCQVNVGGSQMCGETQTLDIIKEFNRLYESKMQELNRTGGGDNLLAKVNLQQNWIRDLTEQNDMLVSAVEELEKEAADRVSLLEERLESGAKVMQKYKDNCSVYLNETFQKLEYLQNDVCNLVEFIKRVRDNRQWSIDGLQFYTINASCLLRSCSCFCDCPTSLMQNIPVQDKPTLKPQNKETAMQDVQKLDTKLVEMEKRLSLSPKDTDVQELNFKLHLKDEELNSIKRSSMAVRDSLLIEVAEKHDDVYSLSRDLQKLERQCSQAKEEIKCKDDYIKRLRQQITLSQEKSLGSGRSRKSPNIERISLEKDNSIKNVSVEAKKLDRRCQEECQKSFAKDIIIKELKKEIQLLKDRIAKLEEATKSPHTSATQQPLIRRPRPLSLSPRPTVAKKRHTIQSRKSLLPNPTSNYTSGKLIQPKRAESPESYKRNSLNNKHSRPRSCSPPCFCSRPNRRRVSETLEEPCSLCFCSKSRCLKPDQVILYSRENSPRCAQSSSSSRSLLDILEYADLKPLKSAAFSSKKRSVSVGTSKSKSPNSPCVYLYESDVKHNNLNTKKEMYMHKNSEENVLLTLDDCYYNSNANAKTSLNNVSNKRCTLTASKILHEYYGISNSSGSHGVIKNFQEMSKVNLFNVPKRIPIKTYINNLELNIKKNAVDIKKRVQSSTASKNKKVS